MRIRTHTRLALSLLGATALAGLARADQNSIRIPETSAESRTRSGLNTSSFDDTVRVFLNPALRSIAGNFNGSSCDAIASPVPYQWCVDTGARALKIYSASTGGAYSWNTAQIFNSDGSVAPNPDPQFNPNWDNHGHLLDALAKAFAKPATAFGIVGDGSDESDKIETAINNGGAVYFPAPPVEYKTTRTVAMNTPTKVLGDGCAPYTTVPFGTAARGSGSWFHFAHLGVGLSVGNINKRSGYEISGICTQRDQPAATAGWAPIAADYDIVLTNTDSRINDVMLWNATKGIAIVNAPSGAGGRNDLARIRGQVMQVGISIDGAQDVQRLEDIHFWPYWNNDTNVNAYTAANAQALALSRADNPIISNFFAISNNVCIAFYQTANGRMLRGQFSNIGCDFTQNGIFVDSSVTSGITAQFTNAYFFGAPSGSALGAVINGNNNLIDFSNVEFANSLGTGLTIGGTGNRINITNPRADIWNLNGTGASLFNVGAGNVLTLASDVTTTYGGTMYFGSGTITAPNRPWTTFTPTVACGTGTLTTLGTNTGRYKLNGPKTMTVEYDTTATTIGTCGGSIKFTIPNSGVANSAASLVGKEVALTAANIGATVDTGGTVFAATKYDGTFLGSNGSRYILSGTVELQ